MINSVNCNSWYQFQSTARFVQSSGVAGGDGTASSSPTDQPAFTLEITQRNPQEQFAAIHGSSQRASQEQNGVMGGDGKLASSGQTGQPAFTPGIPQGNPQEQSATMSGVNQLAPQGQNGVAGSDDKSASSGLVAQPIAPPAVQPADKPAAASGVNQLTSQEQREVDALKQRDREVRVHEQTHKAQLGPYSTGGPFYTYEVGPDNKRYAVGGSVGVDTNKESTPEKTIQKAQVIRRASTAVANPSGADKAVASRASQMEREARAEMMKEQQQERRDISREMGAYQQVDPAKTVAQGLNLIA